MYSRRPILDADRCPGPQSFFAYRVFLLSRSYLIVGISSLASLTQFSFTTTVFVLSYESDIATLKQRYGWLVTSVTSLSVFVDIVNTLALTFFLWRQRSSITVFVHFCLLASAQGLLILPGPIAWWTHSSAGVSVRSPTHFFWRNQADLTRESQRLVWSQRTGVYAPTVHDLTSL